MQLLAGFSVEADRPSGSKEVRAEPFLSQAQAGNVRLLKADWNRSYIDEMTAFPTGVNDDQWDATSGAFNKLHKKKKQTFRLELDTEKKAGWTESNSGQSESFRS